MLEKLKENSGVVRKDIRERVTAYIAGALGLVAGLAWNDAIKALIEAIFPLSKNTIIAKFMYAIIMTLVLVLITTYALRLLKTDEKK